MEIDTLLDRLALAPEFEGGSPASPEQIAAIESALRVSLSPSYERFLTRFGFAIWDGNALFGVYELGNRFPKSFDFDTCRQTTRARNESLPGGVMRIPDEGNVVKRYEGGGWYILFSADSARPGQVRSLSMTLLAGGKGLAFV